MHAWQVLALVLVLVPVSVRVRVLVLVLALVLVLVQRLEQMAQGRVDTASERNVETM